MPKTLNLSVRRGSTFTLALRWEGESWQYAAITGISQTAPAQITSTEHAIPDGWRVAVIDAKGLTQLNALNNPPKDKDMRRASVVSGTVIEFNDTSAAGFAKHTPSTGYLAWLTPQSLAGYAARMQIKDHAGGAVLISLTSDIDGGIALDDVAKLIGVTITATQTEAIGWTAGVYDLEVVSPNGTVEALLEGTVSVLAEITTP